MMVDYAFRLRGGWIGGGVTRVGGGTWRRLARSGMAGSVFWFYCQTAWEHGSAFSRHEMPEVCVTVHPR